MTVDEGRLTKLKEGFDQQELEQAFSYAVGKNRIPDYSEATTLNVPDSSHYTRTVLAQGLNEPLEMALLSEGDVLFVERKGAVKVYDNETRKVKPIANFNVFSGIEDGLLGVALDPQFPENHWIYFYYSVAKKSVNRLSRFELIGDSLAQASEKIMLEIPTQRIYCCHSAGYLAFDGQGNLYLSTGDNTNAEDPLVEGYPPVDERPGHELADDQATAANTDNLKGKILRITPEDDGGYSIPDGNLFPKDGSKGRPEIYIMGSRNPFRFTVDKKNNYLYWGDVGPDTKVKGENGEFMSYDEINQAKEPGFYGWPYFLGNNQAFPHYDYATKKEGPKKNPVKPINDSPNNTGQRILPPAQGAMIWYGKGNSREFPLVGNGGTSAMVGPVYYSELYPDTPYKLSEYYDGKIIIYEWIRGWLMAVTLDENGDYLRMEPFLGHLEFSAPVDVQISEEDGAIYVLEYGTNWFSKNTDAKLVRIEYKEGNRNPVAEITINNQYGATPLKVQLSGENSLDHDGNDKLKYHWDIDGKKLQGEKVDYTFTKAGVHDVKLTLTDEQGGKAITTSHVYAGNSPPEVHIETSANRSFYWDNSVLGYKIIVKDKEDAEIALDKVNLSFGYVPQGEDVALILSGNQDVTSFQYLKGQKMVASMDCRACHAMDEISVGPSYLAISKRYVNDKDAVEKLAAKIIEGGSGAWGAHAMSPHPNLSIEDAEEMVNYILSLSNKGKGGLPLEDNVSLKEHIGQGTKGTYLLSASYTDKGANGIEPLQSRDPIILRHPQVEAEDFDQGTAGIGTNTSNEFYAFIRGVQGGYMRFDHIDLRDIKELNYRLRPMSKGKIEVRLDKFNGPVISSVSVPSGSSAEGHSSWKELPAPLKPTQGIHNLYFVFIAENGTGKQLFDIDWVYFSNRG